MYISGNIIRTFYDIANIVPEKCKKIRSSQVYAFLWIMALDVDLTDASSGTGAPKAQVGYIDVLSVVNGVCIIQHSALSPSDWMW